MHLILTCSAAPRPSLHDIATRGPSTLRTQGGCHTRQGPDSAECAVNIGSPPQGSIDLIPPSVDEAHPLVIVVRIFGILLATVMDTFRHARQ